MDRVDSSGAKETMCSVFMLRSTSARAVIISLTYKPAPNEAHSPRKGASVTPAIGARTTGGSTVSGPIRSAITLAAPPRGW